MAQNCNTATLDCLASPSHHIALFPAADMPDESAGGGRVAVSSTPLYRTDADTVAVAVAAAALATQRTVRPMAAVTPPAYYQPNLDLHNSYRSRHINTTAFYWDDVVAASAATYAAKCYWGHNSTDLNLQK